MTPPESPKTLLIDWHLPPESGHLTVHLSRPVSWILAALVGLLLVGGLGLARQNRRLKTDVSRMQEDLDAVQSRERELEEAVVDQHHRLQDSAQDIEVLHSVDQQLAQMEIQLDGIDYLAGRLREGMGLPPGSGTWDQAAIATPQGGGPDGAVGVEGARLSLLQRRVVTGMTELLRLQAVLEQRGKARPEAINPLAGLDPRTYTVPANWPARGPVTSPYGWRKFRGLNNFHTGTDISMPLGSGVQATGGGMVLGSGWQPSYGNCVLIQHAQGYSTLYAHLQQTLVQKGQVVKQGDWIGLSGSSGNSTGPHLHYELWKNGMVVDPQPSMDGG